MRRTRKERTHRRRIQAIRGKRLVVFAVTISILYGGIFLALTFAHNRWLGGLLSSSPVVATLIALVLFIIGASLAIGAYLGHPILRPCYVVINFLGAILGILWIGFQAAQRSVTDWFLFDAVAIGAAILICWVFVGSKRARAFFEEQEFIVKRN